jgi:hypothetical protein
MYFCLQNTDFKGPRIPRAVLHQLAAHAVALIYAGNLLVPPPWPWPSCRTARLWVGAHHVRSLTAPRVLPCCPSAMLRKARTHLIALVVIFVLATLTVCSMLRKARTLRLALVAVFLLAMLAVLFLTLGRTPPPVPLPNPNGYDDFLKGASLVAGNVGNADTLDHEALRALVSTNAESLRLLRLGLTRHCALPADSAMTNVSGMLNDLAAMKQLVQLLVAEGRLREMDNRFADAAQSYLDAIRFGKEMSRGGFFINRLVGIACEAIGSTALSKLVPKLDPQEARPVISELEKIDGAGVTWEEVQLNENRFFRYQLRRELNPITWVMALWNRRLRNENAERKDKRVIAHERLLAAELALRCYQSEQGRLPTSLEQLVPKYLQQVPTDPFSGRPVIYHAQGTNWLLYSVGEDGVDDGGERVGRSVSGTVTKGDLFYDSPY